MPSLRYEYGFSFANGKKKIFVTSIDEDTLEIIPHSPERQPAPWTHLSYKQCPCCPLLTSAHSHCPIAVNLSELVSSFRAIASYESCRVSCRTVERTVSKETNVQDGLSSIMGLIMATSGCPVMEILKPMARFHLPFATVDEAMFRSISVYLLRQYFIHLESGYSDFHLAKVKASYGEIEKVNGGILERIRGASELDADRNAIVILNCLAQFLYLELDDNLQSLRHLFVTTASF
ncbi:MAG TPA: hypothetical protein VJ969_08915 [Desulfopila sp.]|nr:hypothetical protein [Desulfopila sp.]